jgi:HPt (histidine-containing phosphotransfer) domain-containing protein
MSTSTSFPTELRLPAPRPRAIDVAAALEQVGGDYEFVMAVMRDEFLAKAPDQIARCVANARLADARVADAAAKDTRDDALKALAFEAHSMKGASATLHAAALSKACHRLERVAKGVPLDALEPDSGAYGEPTAPRTFEQRTREMADRFAELEADVADLAAITDVDVAAASEALGSRLCVTLARLAGDAAALAASPAALEAAAARAGGVGRNPSHTRHRREPLASLARTVAADAKAVGARALRNAVRRMDALVFSCDETLDHALEKTCGEDKRGQIFEDVVAAYVELRRAAQTVAFDCAAVCSREETAGFARRAREALGGAADSFKKPPPALARTSLVDASTARGDLFDAAATAADTRRFFHSPPTSADGEEATSTSGIETSKPKPRNLGDLGHLDAGADGAPPVDFPRAVRALDGDVAFAEKMLRTFLADAESFTSKPLGSPSPLAGDRRASLGSRARRFREKPERAGTRLSEERRRDAERLGETADWLGAPPLRAAIATLLDGDAGEHAVRAARRAVRDLRAFADGLESNIAGGGFGGNDLNDARDARPGGSPLPSLPKKSASTDQVMRSGLYAYSSSSVGTSGGASADSNEDSDGKSHRGSFGSDRDRDGRRSSTDSERFGSRLAASRGSWGGSSGRVSADSAGAAEGAVTALAALAPRARARGAGGDPRAPAATRRPRLRPAPGAGARGRRLGLRGCVRGETRRGGARADRRAPRGAFRRRFLFFFFFVAARAA